ncbi:hypothetical protein TH53_23090 [Pedobacter lusitanus]|uniref:Contig119, whole genome shotgun sequence n=1 Tax=Pedobacter lusitanus TaxID=1503925 RepID=A0A0D0GKQ0_9SPHI|nr:hypothetical protein [Pedobacter lusitanus]KIO75006.1 hypothetical protein TH53_23090 [Pedobacter lusitanus]
MKTQNFKSTFTKSVLAAVIAFSFVLSTSAIAAENPQQKDTTKMAGHKMSKMAPSRMSGNKVSAKKMDKMAPSKMSGSKMSGSKMSSKKMNKMTPTKMAKDSSGKM